tara:strand:- start:19 stop:222 length:204 start_codon:yes stop_codon:yes gene_type:complete
MKYTIKHRYIMEDTFVVYERNEEEAIKEATKMQSTTQKRIATEYIDVKPFEETRIEELEENSLKDLL